VVAVVAIPGVEGNLRKVIVGMSDGVVIVVVNGGKWSVGQTKDILGHE